jgi:hypothetical protein
MRRANPVEAVGSAQQPAAAHAAASQSTSAAAVAVRTPSPSPPPSAAAPSPFQTAQVVQAAESEHAEPARAPESADEPGRVELLVRTEPAGARLNVFGKDTRERCKETPCSVSIPRGQPVRIRAVLGSAIVRKKVQLAEDGEIELKFASASRAAMAEEHEREAAPSDLKVPALFR